MRNYPVVPVKPVVDEYFGHKVYDPYRYLEDAKSPETMAIVQAENDYTHAFFRNNTEFSAAEIEAQLRSQPYVEELLSVKEACGVICAARKLEGGVLDIVRLDENMQVCEVVLNEEMLNNRMHFDAVLPSPTRPGIYAVLGIIHGHPRDCVIVWDANQKKMLAELDGTFSHDWSADGKYLYYAEAELDAANDRNINRIRRYSMDEDRIDTMYTHYENAVAMEVYTGPDGGCIFNVMINYSDVLVIWHDPDGSITRLNDGLNNYVYIGEANGRSYFKTNAGAAMSRIVSLTREQLNQEGSLMHGFETAVAESDAMLKGAGIIPGGILAVYERNAATELAVFDFSGNKIQDIALPDPFGCGKFGETVHVSDRNRVLFSFESFTRRLSLYELDIPTLQIRCLRGDDRDVSDITVDQCFLKARDGQQILTYIVRLKDQKPTGDIPTLMFGYGGYAASMPPWPENTVVCHNIVDWVRKGRIYAHCTIRGGLEYGEEWHRAAMFDNKKNAFHDFIDIAEYLIAQGWTKPGQIVATGKSNGGLLMSAIATIRPDLFGVVIASVPHTDMLRFRYDARGMMYITEYGDPESSEAMFEYMHSYSPYHNVKEGTRYPWMYIQTGEMDNNVPPYHGKKFAVRLQSAADEAHPVLLQVLPHGSHNRGTGDEFYLNISQAQAFIEMGLAAQR